MRTKTTGPHRPARASGSSTDTTFRQGRGLAVDNDERSEAASLLREVIARECARVDDPGASIPGADPDDGHGWHSWTPDQPAEPRRPGVPVFNPDCWRFFRLLDLGWLQDTLLVTFAWDELGTPDLAYTTPVGFLPDVAAHGPRAVALTARGHLRWLLAPNDLAVRLTPNPHATPLKPGRHWRERCGRLWLGPHRVLVFPGPAPDQHELDGHWQLPWPSPTNSPLAGPSPPDSPS